MKNFVMKIFNTVNKILCSTCNVIITGVSSNFYVCNKYVWYLEHRCCGIYRYNTSFLIFQGIPQKRNLDYPNKTPWIFGPKSNNTVSKAKKKPKYKNSTKRYQFATKRKKFGEASENSRIILQKNFWKNQ